MLIILLTNGNLGFQIIPVIYTCQKCCQEFYRNLCISNKLFQQFQQKVRKDQPSQDPTSPSALTSSLAWPAFFYDYITKPNGFKSIVFWVTSNCIKRFKIMQNN